MYKQIRKRRTQNEKDTGNVTDGRDDNRHTVRLWGRYDRSGYRRGSNVSAQETDNASDEGAAAGADTQVLNLRATSFGNNYDVQDMGWRWMMGDCYEGLYRNVADEDGGALHPGRCGERGCFRRWPGIYLPSETEREMVRWTACYGP